ncbi:hypothetical protein VFPBJ_11379 [Purpureocillium lilacinum]|uniref:Uncharacterized protein n=1 Tax=Purpureocillium lilacinum TaxID=33203 RepID=A0A179FAY5_PURLI|nr:hypothetical protein VFPBJ_11379 [Purpureocillium lilacinum]
MHAMHCYPALYQESNRPQSHDLGTSSAAGLSALPQKSRQGEPRVLTHKCTGEKPRTRCAAEGQYCVVDSYQEEEDLRAEIEYLRRREEQNNIILDALSSRDDVDTYNMVAEGLLNSTMTRQAVAHQLSNKAGTNLIRQEVADDQGRFTSRAIPVVAPSSELPPALCPYCSAAAQAR